MLKTTKVIFKSFRSSLSNSTIRNPSNHLALKPALGQSQSGQRSFVFNNYKKSNQNEDYNNFSNITSAGREGKYSRNNDGYSKENQREYGYQNSGYDQDTRRSSGGYPRQERVYLKPYNIMKDNALLSTNMVKVRMLWFVNLLIIRQKLWMREGERK